jgi:D-xylose transport system ATP-binding protein
MSTSPANRAALLEMRAIGKSFPGVRALDGVTFDLYPGEIHALVGENGAGKSTLMKILGGVYPYPSYDGGICIEGQTKRFRTVRESEHAGIAIVFQELSLVPELTVGENIFLGREPGRFGVVNWDGLYARAAALLNELKLDINPQAQVGKLGTGRQQLVEIAKALSQNARILVLDEPTAALTDAEAESLFAVLEQLRLRGIGTIYISHRLEEVFRLSDRITVLRDGRTISTDKASTLNQSQVIARMVGREVSQIFPTTKRKIGDVVLEARHLNAEEPVTGKHVVNDVSFSVRQGEVLGLAGLMGAGRTETLQCLFGAFPGKSSGEIFIGGKKVQISKPADAMAQGIGFVTEDRKRSGLVLDQTILRNMTLAALPKLSGRFTTDESREVAASTPVAESLRVKASSLYTIAGTLSGGNQQKIVLGKWLLNTPKVLLLDEPTRGIDVGAKQEIYATIAKLAESGMAVIMVSSELPEVLGLSDRVVVLHEGKMTGEFTREQATPEAVMAAATGQVAHA